VRGNGSGATVFLIDSVLERYGAYFSNWVRTHPAAPRGDLRRSRRLGWRIALLMRLGRTCRELDAPSFCGLNRVIDLVEPGSNPWSRGQTRQLDTRRQWSRGQTRQLDTRRQQMEPGSNPATGHQPTVQEP
jgi:hypothetical protein